MIKKKLSRGRIEVFVKLEKEENQDVDIRVDLSLAKSYKESLDLIRQELGIEKPVKLDNILSIADVLKLEKEGRGRGTYFKNPNRSCGYGYGSSFRDEKKRGRKS